MRKSPKRCNQFQVWRGAFNVVVCNVAHGGDLSEVDDEEVGDQEPDGRGGG